MKKSFIAAAVFLTSFFILSTIADAQSTLSDSAAQGIGTLAGLINGFTATVVRALGGLAMAAAMVAFFYGIVQYIWGIRQGDATKTKNGNQFMIWGLVALFVMFSVYGIIKFVQSTLCSTCDFTTITIPDVNFIKSKSDDGTKQNTDAGSRDPLRTTAPNNTNGSVSPLGFPTETTSAGSNGGENYDSRVAAPPDAPCQRANGGRCRIGGQAGSCSDWTCIPD